MLTGLIFLPAVVALLIALAPAKAARALAILGAALTAGLSLATLSQSDSPTGGFRGQHPGQVRSGGAGRCGRVLPRG